MADGFLKPLDSLLANTLVATIRPANVCYALVDVMVDFTDGLDDCNIRIKVPTHIVLPQDEHKYKDGNGDEDKVYISTLWYPCTPIVYPFFLIQN